MDLSCKHSRSVVEFQSNPEGMWRDGIIPFLSVNDITDLSMTCREMKEKIMRWCSTPCILWEKRLATKMRISSGLPNCQAAFSQLQTFRFLLRTASEETL